MYTNFFRIPQAPADVTATVDVPVFIIFGDKDFSAEGMHTSTGGFRRIPSFWGSN